MVTKNYWTEMEKKNETYIGLLMISVSRRWISASCWSRSSRAASICSAERGGAPETGSGDAIVRSNSSIIWLEKWKSEFERNCRSTLEKWDDLVQKLLQAMHKIQRRSIFRKPSMPIHVESLPRRTWIQLNIWVGLTPTEFSFLILETCSYLIKKI